MTTLTVQEIYGSTPQLGTIQKASKNGTRRSGPVFMTDCLDMAKLCEMAEGQKFRRLNFDLCGRLVLDASKKLLIRVQVELMAPLGALDRLMENDNHEPIDRQPDWTLLKRKQRYRALRDHWEKIRFRKKLLKDLAGRYPRRQPSLGETEISDAGAIATFCKPFSAAGNKRRAFSAELKELMQAGIARRLPWRQILTQEILRGKATLGELAPILPEHKKDAVLKLQTLLSMANEGSISLKQKSSFGEIHLRQQSENTPDTIVRIKDVRNRTYLLDWRDLRPGQREKVIRDLSDNRVILTLGKEGVKNGL
jgi:hypothetical protein